MPHNTQQHRSSKTMQQKDVQSIADQTGHTTKSSLLSNTDFTSPQEHQKPAKYYIKKQRKKYKMDMPKKYALGTSRKISPKN
eukprot:2453092-Ditylum_brightwellii.AAC.1